MQGEALHNWHFPLTPGNYAYMLPTGNLLWSGRTTEGPPLRRGKGGLMREMASIMIFGVVPMATRFISAGSRYPMNTPSA
jgi:hypothetical protein